MSTISVCVFRAKIKTVCGVLRPFVGLYSETRFWLGQEINLRFGFQNCIVDDLGTQDGARVFLPVFNIKLDDKMQ